MVMTRMQELLAAAWDEGYAAGEYMAKCWGHVDYWENEPSNPYLDGTKAPLPSFTVKMNVPTGSDS